MSFLINDTETIIMYAANNDNDIVRIYIFLILVVSLFFGGVVVCGFCFFNKPLLTVL